MRSSRGEIKIEEILQMNGFDFAEEYSFPDLVSSSGRPLRFDFVVFDEDGEVDFLIEYQGLQHYEARSKFGGARGLFRQQHNDRQKQIYCTQHHITLVTIPYWDIDRVNYDYIIKAAYGDYANNL